MTSAAKPADPKLDALNRQLAELQAQQAINAAQVGAINALIPSITATVSKDTITSSPSTTGLAKVLVQFDLEYVADDLATVIKHSLAKNLHPALEVRIVNDLSALDDVTVHDLLTAQLHEYQGQLNAYLKPAPANPEHPPAERAPDQHRSVFAGLPAAAGLAGQAVTLVTQLIAGSYQYGGAAVSETGVVGLDLLLAHRLAGAPVADRAVRVDRLQPPRDTSVRDALLTLFTDAGTRLAGAIEQAEGAAAEALAAATDPATHAVAGEAQGRVDAGKALATNIGAFVSACLASTAGAPAPVTRAAHGAELKAANAIIVYTRPVAAGVDQVTGSRFFRSRWSTLSGVSVEYAVFTVDGSVLASGVRTVLQSAHGAISNGLKTISRDRSYPPMEWDPPHRQIPAPPTPSGTTSSGTPSSGTTSSGTTSSGTTPR